MDKSNFTEIKAMKSFLRNKNAYSRVLFILILAFLCYYIYGSVNELPLHLHKINYTSLALSFFYVYSLSTELVDLD
jgi:hypothetical protein